MYFMLLVDVKVRVDLEDVKEGKKKMSGILSSHSCNSMNPMSHRTDDNYLSEQHRRMKSHMHCGVKD